MSESLPVFGWREWAAFPQLGIGLIKAKVDTGARTSSLHAHVQDRYVDSGTPMIAFTLYLEQIGDPTEIRTSAPIIDERNVRSSNGMVERRYFIATDIVMGAHTWPIEISLTARDTMGFHLLLGRQALRRRALVDSTRSFTLGKPQVPSPK